MPSAIKDLIARDLIDLATVCPCCISWHSFSNQSCHRWLCSNGRRRVSQKIVATAKVRTQWGRRNARRRQTPGFQRSGCSATAEEWCKLGFQRVLHGDTRQRRWLERTPLVWHEKKCPCHKKGRCFAVGVNWHSSCADVNMLPSMQKDDGLIGGARLGKLKFVVRC